MKIFIPIFIIIYFYSITNLLSQTAGIYFNEEENRASVVKIIGLDRNEQPVLQGSGVIVSGDGIVATAGHCLTGICSGYVELNNGLRFPFNKSENDPNSDVALIKIEAENLPEVRLGSTRNIKMNSDVMLIGYSRDGLDVKPGKIKDFSQSGNQIEVSANVVSGNSGGIVIDNSGAIIGIIRAHYINTVQTFITKVEEIKSLLDKNDWQQIECGENDCNQIDILLDSAAIYYQSNDFRTAWNYLNRIITCDINNFMANYYLAEINFQLGHYTQSNIYFGRAIKNFPKIQTMNLDSCTIFDRAGVSNLKSASYQIAKNLFLRELECDSISPIPRRNLALTYYKLKDYRNAIKYFLEAYELNPDLVESCQWATLASWYKEIGDNENAVIYYSRALSEGCRSSEIYYELYTLGENNDSTFRTVNNVETLNGIAEEFLDNNDIANARAVLNRVFIIDQNNEDAKRLYCSSVVDEILNEERRGNYEGCLEIFQNAPSYCESIRDDWQRIHSAILYNLVKRAYDNEDYESAENYFEHAPDSAPQLIDGWNELGCSVYMQRAKIQVQAGNITEARNLLERAPEECCDSINGFQRVLCLIYHEEIRELLEDNNFNDASRLFNQIPQCCKDEGNNTENQEDFRNLECLILYQQIAANYDEGVNQRSQEAAHRLYNQADSCRDLLKILLSDYLSRNGISVLETALNGNDQQNPDIQISRSIDYLHEALFYDPDNLNSRFYLIRAYFENGNYNNALNSTEHFFTSYNEKRNENVEFDGIGYNVPAWIWKASILLKMNNPDTARKIIRDNIGSIRNYLTNGDYQSLTKAAILQYVNYNIELFRTNNAERDNTGRDQQVELLEDFIRVLQPKELIRGDLANYYRSLINFYIGLHYHFTNTRDTARKYYYISIYYNLLIDKRDDTDDILLAENYSQLSKIFRNRYTQGDIDSVCQYNNLAIEILQRVNDPEESFIPNLLRDVYSDKVYVLKSIKTIEDLPDYHDDNDECYQRPRNAEDKERQIFDFCDSILTDIFPRDYILHQECGCAITSLRATRYYNMARQWLEKAKNELNNDNLPDNKVHDCLDELDGDD